MLVNEVPALPDRGGSHSRRPRVKLPISATLVVGLLYAGLLLFGADRNDLGLGFSTAWLFALPLLLTQEWARKSIERTKLRWVGLLFGLTLLAGLVSLTPFRIDGPQPIWSLVPGVIASGSLDPYATWMALIKLLGLGAAFLAGACFGGDADRAKQLLRAILAAGLAYGIWAFINFETSPTLLFGQPRHIFAYRLEASLPSPNVAAALFGSFVLLNLADLVRQLDRDQERRSSGFRLRDLDKVLVIIALPSVGIAVAATCLVLTYSRVGIAASFAAVGILCGVRSILLTRRRGFVFPLALSVLLIGGFVAVSISININSLSARASLFKDDIGVRAGIFAAHWAAFTRSPWQGYGLGTFRQINSMITNNANRDYLFGIGATHDVYIQWLEEAGILGATPMFCTIALIATRTIAGIKQRKRMRMWLIAIVSILGLFMLTGTTDFALQVPAISIFLSLLLGLGYRMASR